MVERRLINGGLVKLQVFRANRAAALKTELRRLADFDFSTITKKLRLQNQYV